jgi:3-oxoacyl-[acyl-carrier-protein] synthase-3
MDVFNFALKEVAPSIKLMLENFDINIDDIDYFVLHQANKLINESVRKKLKVTPEKVPYSIQNFGNTSSASIPLTICTCLKEKIESDQLTLLLAGFGVGFSWGSVVLKTSEIRTKIVEHD